jgi:hypothetical protein
MNHRMSVGIAMGAAGTDAALQSADVALISDDLTRLPDALTGARQAIRVMRQNVVASLVVKAVFVLLAPLGLVTLVMAVAADYGHVAPRDPQRPPPAAQATAGGGTGARLHAGLQRRLLLARVIRAGMGEPR